jgi:hypothetical protein
VDEMLEKLPDSALFMNTTLVGLGCALPPIYVKTVAALGIAVPPSILVCADKVIE